MQLIRDIYYLASEAAYVPVRLVQALAEGLTLGWETTRPSGDDDVITHGPAWHNDDHCPTATCGSCPAPTTCEALRVNLMSSTDGAVTDPAVERSPAAAASATDAAAGHPIDDDLRRILTAAALGLNWWAEGLKCGGPTYFKSIAHDLEHLAK